MATGLAGITPLVIGATPAAADVNWDAIAQCESGGQWNINTGNGYQGGLQFSPSTWRSHGGTQFARGAHNATRAQQITVAKRVLRSQGIGAWPTCGGRGYTKHRYRTSSSSWSGSSERATRSYRRQGSANYTRSWEKRATEYRSKSHRWSGKKSWYNRPTENRSYRQSLSKKRHYTALAAPKSTAVRTAEVVDFVPLRQFSRDQRPAAAAPRVLRYLVRPGDSLVTIATTHKVSWLAVYERNLTVIGANPDVIRPGQRLLIG